MQTTLTTAALILLSIFSFRVEAKTPAPKDATRFYYVATTPFAMETGYRRTSGLGGALFGHISTADANQVIQAGQRKLLAELQAQGINVKKAQLLPVEMVEARSSVVGEGNRTRKGVLGSVHQDSFQNFRLEGKLRIAFVHTARLNLPGFQRKEIAGTKLVLKDISGRTIGKGTPVKIASLKLNAISTGLVEANELGALKLRKAVPAKARYALGDAIRKTTDAKTLKRQPLRAVAVLKFKDATKATVTVGEGTHNDQRAHVLRALKLRGVGRFLSPRYGLHRVGKLVRRLRPTHK
ncbi:MAG: hypothetical protein KAI47_28320 [Deltaproteobacteria bacterium]|nr:hypothetical protein [Deltaproteobacteria bacterium]